MINSRSLLWLLAATLVTTTSAAQEQPSSQPQEKLALQVKELDSSIPVKLKYLVSTPADYESQEKWPLVLFLHGAGERGDNVDQIKVHGPPKLIGQGQSFPFILVAPQCPQGQWWEPQSLSLLLDEVETDYHVDPDRIYVTGLSMGGFGTFALAAHSPERFAAIAPICGGGDRTVIPYRIGTKVPAWIFHGAKDRVVPLNRSVELFEALESRSAEVKLTVYPDAGHDSWSATYSNPKLYDWLLSHSKSTD